MSIFENLLVWAIATLSLFVTTPKPGWIGHAGVVLRGGIAIFFGMKAGLQIGDWLWKAWNCHRAQTGPDPRPQVEPKP